MRKWLISTVIVVVILLLLPFAFGLHAQYLLHEMNGLRIPVKGGELGAVELAVSDTKIGWLHSSATIKVNYQTPAHGLVTKGTTAPVPVEAEPLKHLFTAQTQITHGPLLWRSTESDKRPVWGQAWVDAPVEFVTDNFPDRFLQIAGMETGRVRGYVSLLGAQTVYVDTNEISFQDPLGQLSFSGFALELQRSLGGKDVALDLLVPHFNFVLYPNDARKDGARWLMDGIELKFAGVIDHPMAFIYGTWFGEANATIKMMQVNYNGKNYGVNQLTASSMQVPGTDEKLLDGKADVNIENLMIDQRTFGPMEANINYFNIDRSAVEDMRRMYDSWFSTNTNQPFLNSLTPEQRKEFFNDVFTFVNRLPRYDVDNFILVTDAGSVSGDLSLSVVAPAKTVEDVNTVSFWEQSVDAKIDLTASNQLVQNVAGWVVMQFYNWLNPLITTAPATPNVVTPEGPAVPTSAYQAEALSLINQAQTFGLIKNMDNQYSTAIVYQQGLLSINDKTIIDWSSKNTPVSPVAP